MVAENACSPRRICFGRTQKNPRGPEGGAGKSSVEAHEGRLTGRQQTDYFLRIVKLWQLLHISSGSALSA